MEQNQTQTLEPGDYFLFNDVHKGGYYRVVAKSGNLYYVWCNLKLDPGCHGMFHECPFPDHQKECETEIETKIVLKDNPHYGGCHFTCMMIDPAKVHKVAALRGLMDNPDSADIEFK